MAARASEAPPAKAEPENASATPGDPIDTAGTASTPAPPFNGDHAFAAALYASQARVQQGNLIVSPASARVALAMAYAGARGDTAREMASVLALPADVSRATAEVSATVKAWNDERDPKVKLAVANAFFAQRAWPFEATFEHTLRDAFGAPMQLVDFAHDGPGIVGAVNRFAAAHTDNEITSVLRPGDVSPTTRAILVNATFFKGAWRTTFPAAATAPGPFHVAKGQDVTAPLMHVTSGFSIGWTRDAAVLSMPYGAGGYSMVVVLPNEQDGLAALESRITGATIDAWLAAPHESNVIVTLPRFQAEAETRLKDALAGMGMPRAFDEHQADLTGIGTPPPPERLYLSNVVQKAKVKVDEAGTVAAAVTALMVVMTISSDSRMPVTPTFTADHPFLYVIRDARGNVLFMGRVARP